MYVDGESFADRGGHAVGGNAQVVAHVGAHNVGQQQDFALDSAHNCNKASSTRVYNKCHKSTTPRQDINSTCVDHHTAAAQNKAPTPSAAGHWSRPTFVTLQNSFPRRSCTNHKLLQKQPLPHRVPKHSNYLKSAARLRTPIAKNCVNYFHDDFFMDAVGHYSKQ